MGYRARSARWGEEKTKTLRRLLLLLACRSGTGLRRRRCCRCPSAPTAPAAALAGLGGGDDGRVQRARRPQVDVRRAHVLDMEPDVVREGVRDQALVLELVSALLLVVEEVVTREEVEEERVDEPSSSSSSASACIIIILLLSPLLFLFSSWPAPCRRPICLRPRGHRCQSRKPLEQKAGLVFFDKSTIGFFFLSFVRSKKLKLTFFVRIEKKRKKVEKKMALRKTAAASAAAAFLILFAASLTFVSSSEAPDPVSFRADDGVTQISGPEEFSEAISRSRKAACVYFYLPRCPACAQTKTVLLTAANKLDVCVCFDWVEDG